MATKDHDRWRTRVGGQSVTFPKDTPKKVVDEYEAKVKLRLIGVGSEAPTVSEYAKRFQDAYQTIRKRAVSTKRKDFFSLRDHILPRFGGRRLGEIRAGDVLAWQVDLVATGLAPQTVNNVVACLSALFRFACLEGKADFNPCAAVPRVPRPKAKPVFWTPAEARQFLSYVRVHAFGVYQICLTAICSGMRPGELMGLKRDCLNFDHGYVDVRRNYCTKLRQVVEHTKGGTEGKVPLPRLVLEALADKRALGPDELVFPKLHLDRAFGWLTMRPLAIAAGVKPIGFHKLRHTFASHLVLGRKHPKEIQTLLRHKKGDSSEIYMHLIDEVPTGATDCIAEGLGDLAFTGGNVRSLHGSRV